jgi:hypothetical protein
MLLALLLSQLAVQPSSPVGPIFSSPATMGQLAFFEAFPSNGRGTTGVCSTVAPTGAKGEALTFTRGSNGTCTRTAAGGLSTTGIANGDLVVLSSNVARQMYDANGVLGLLVEASRTNSNLQSANLADAAYTSVGAPTVTANTTVSPDGTTTMATIDDTSGAAQQGRQQVIVATAGQPYTLSVYVKADTLASVTVSLDGTTATCTSLSATTSTRCIVTDASASGVAINAQVLGGTVVGDTGTFRAWGQQVELGLYATSYMPTGAGTATRSAESASFPTAINTTNGLSHASTLSFVGPPAAILGAMSLYQDALNRTQLYESSTNALNADIFTTSGTRSTSNVPGTWLANTPYRIGLSHSGAGASSTVSSYLSGVLQTTSATGLTSAYTSVRFGPGLNAVGDGADAIYTRWCADPVVTRCR